MGVLAILVFLGVGVENTGTLFIYLIWGVLSSAHGSASVLCFWQCPMVFFL